MTEDDWDPKGEHAARIRLREEAHERLRLGTAAAHGGDREAVAHERGQDAVRAKVEGKLKVDSKGLLPVDPNTGLEVTGVSGNWWLGLDLMHTLFTLEHNSSKAGRSSRSPCTNSKALASACRS